MRVLGMGNALVDIMTKVDDDFFLHQHNLPKGSMQLVDWDKAGAVIQGSLNFEKSLASGGSAANTIHGLAKMGVQTAFIGKVGNDEMGDFFSSDLVANGIESKLLKSDNKSGMAVALVSKDAERTFATFLGAAVELSANDLYDEMFKGFDLFHIEGYLVQNHELIETAIEMAKRNGLKVSLDLASYNVVDDNLDFLLKISNDIHIIFANEEEAKSFTGYEPEYALEEIAKKAKIAVVKVGARGSLVKVEDNVFRAGAIEANSIDTTGAGDLYASGFIYGLTQGFNFDKCAEMGSILAGNVIEVVGAKMDENRWNKIYSLTGK